MKNAYDAATIEGQQFVRRLLDDSDRRQESEALRSIGIDRPAGERDESGALAMLPEGGYHIQIADDGVDRTGMHAHRGVLEEGEYVDHEELIMKLEEELGFSFDEVRLAFDAHAYAEEVPNFYAIRERMVEIHEDGGNISLLADVLGINRGTLATAIWRQKQRRKGQEA